MPYLNWKERETGQEVRDSLFTLRLKSRELAELIALLEEVFVENGPELRVDLPRNWIVFWKRREGESRLLIAHPQENEWVATAALEPEHGKKLIDELKTLQTGSANRVTAVGNVELEIRRIQES